MSEVNEEYWNEKLVGKVLLKDGETTFEVDKNVQTVKLEEIPEYNRIISPGSFITKDFQTDRLNVCLDDNNVIERVYYG